MSMFNIVWWLQYKKLLSLMHAHIIINYVIRKLYLFFFCHSVYKQRKECFSFFFSFWSFVYFVYIMIWMKDRRVKTFSSSSSKKNMQGSMYAFAVFYFISCQYNTRTHWIYGRKTKNFGSICFTLHILNLFIDIHIIMLLN